MTYSALMTYHATILLLHPTEPRILALSTPHGPAFPQLTWQSAEWSYWTQVAPVNQAMRERFGLDVTTLRCLSESYDADSASLHRIYEMEFRAPASMLPEGARWVAIENLASLASVSPTLRSWYGEWTTDHSALDRAARRAPWYCAGWYEQAASWLEAQTSSMGLRTLAPPEQRSLGERGCLLRVGATDGVSDSALYLKALPAYSAHELALVEHLAHDHPTLVPSLAAVRADAGWMVMRDFGGILLDQCDNLETWDEALRTYAMLQVEQVEQVERLRALGCPQLPVKAVGAHLATLLSDTQTLQPGTPVDLTADEINALHQKLTLVQTFAQQLARSSIPMTLEHGDFHSQNVAVTDDRPLYFDWTDCCVTHPFFSLYPFLLGIEKRWETIPGIRRRFRDVYLQPWRRYAPHDSLVADFEVAQTLAPLYLATLYHQLIIPHLAATWEMRDGVPFNLRMLLQRLQAPGTSPLA